mgnify:CR=1 FL=1
MAVPVENIKWLCQIDMVLLAGGLEESALLNEAEFVVTPLKDQTFDLDAMAERSAIQSTPPFYRPASPLASGKMLEQADACVAAG